MMIMTMRAIAAGVFFLAACGGPVSSDALAPIPNSLFAAEASQQSPLPLEIVEISGMAVTPDGRVFAHDDERAVIYEINPTTGAFVKRFSVGAPLTGDFEGLAIDPQGVFWMITSNGRLQRFIEGADGATVTSESFDTGLRDVCEIEGLAFLPSAGSLIIACKENQGRRMRDTISLYEWRPGGGAAQPWRSIAADDIAAAGIERFQPSSVEIDQRTGRVILLSARDPALLELDGERIVATRHLDRSHIQAEGLAILPDGSLVISDEGGNNRALISVYSRVP